MDNVALKILLVQKDMTAKELSERAGIPYNQALELTTRSKDPRVSVSLKVKRATGMTWEQYSSIFMPAS